MIIKNYLHLFQYIDLLAAAITLSLSVFVFARNPEDRLSRAFSLYSFLLGVASFIDYSFRRTPFEEMALMSFLQRISICGWTFGFSGFLYFAMVYAKKFQALKKPLTFILIYAPSVIICLMYLFTDLGVRGYKQMAYGNAAIIGPGVGVFLLQILIYPYIALGIILAYSFRTKNPVLIKRAWLFVAAVMAPAMAPAISQVILPAVFKILIPPQAIVSSSIFCLLVFIAIRRYGLFQISPERAVKAILQTTYISIIALDTEARISFINKSAGKLLGVEPEFVIHKNISEFLRAEDSELIKGSLLDKSKPLVGRETNITLSSGEMLQVKINGVVLYDILGAKIGAILDLENITEIKNAEEALKSRAAELEKINKFMVGRELEMVELKERLASCQEELQRILKAKEPKE